MAGEDRERTDRRFMAAAIRLSRRHLGLTSTNPSVGTLIVRDGVIVGRGVTAIGGRPHAEPQALAEAGDKARGATAYVTLEPCAHHGRTPPCAEALIAAGVARVVGASSDPDPRVSGRGYGMLRAAGIEVTEGVLAAQAADLMAGYLMRSAQKRPEVILKLAISADGMIGRAGEEVAITGGEARAQVHLMRAESDAVLVGVATVLADDPDLTVRLPGLENRSPARIVLDATIHTQPSARLVRTARTAPTLIVAGPDAPQSRRAELTDAGVVLLAAEIAAGRVALPELLDDLAGRGMATVLVEGGAAVASSFLAEGLVDRIVLFRGTGEIGPEGIAAPIDESHMPSGFRLVRKDRFGGDTCMEWIR